MNTYILASGGPGKKERKKKSIGNPVENQLKFQWNTNGNPVGISMK